MSDSPAPARHANGRFGPGNPGRRAGARNQGVASGDDGHPR